MFNGFLPIVLNMFHDSNDLVCTSACKVLSAIIIDHKENALLALDKDVLSQLCTTLLRRSANLLITDYLSDILVSLRKLHLVRFDYDLKKCRGTRAILQLLNTNNIKVISRIMPIINELSTSDTMQKELFDADGITALTNTLKWVESNAAPVHDIIIGVVNSLTALKKFNKDITSNDFSNVKGYVHVSKILSDKRFFGNVRVQCLELILPVIDMPDVLPDLQLALIDNNALFPILELAQSPEDEVKRSAFLMLRASAYQNEANKAIYRERQALPILASFMNNSHFPSDLKRLALKAAMEIVFVCESSPFWIYLADVLKVRESEQMSEKQKENELQIADEERKKRELELHSMEMSVTSLNDKIATQASELKAKDEEIAKMKVERVDHLTKIDAIGKQFLLLQQQQQQLLQQAELQRQTLQNHITSIEDQLKLSQRDVALIAAKNNELTEERITVQDMHEYMVAIAKFCNVKPPAKRAGLK